MICEMEFVDHLFYFIEPFKEFFLITENCGFLFSFLFDLYIGENAGKFSGWWRIVLFRPFGAIEILVLNEIFSKL